jgi:hypothetical protein
MHHSGDEWARNPLVIQVLNFQGVFFDERAARSAKGVPNGCSRERIQIGNQFGHIGGL